MTAPVVKHKGFVLTPTGGTTKRTYTASALASSDPCPQCAPHLLSDHVVEKTFQCSKCTCVAQDTENA